MSPTPDPDAARLLALVSAHLWRCAPCRRQLDRTGNLTRATRTLACQHAIRWWQARTEATR